MSTTKARRHATGDASFLQRLTMRRMARPSFGLSLRTNTSAGRPRAIAHLLCLTNVACQSEAQRAINYKDVITSPTFRAAALAGRTVFSAARNPTEIQHPNEVCSRNGPRESGSAQD